jgi:DNA-binding beta-propeller fold protein YncE
MKATLATLISIASIALISACAQPSQTLVPSADKSQDAATARARYIYFAGIRLNVHGGTGGFLGPGELGVYPATASGNVPPLHVIAGRKTGLFEGGGCCVPQSAWFDPADRSLWTCRTFSRFISRFSTNRPQSSWGNVRPNDRLAISPQTVSCGGVARTKDGETVADDINDAFVATWSADSTGDAAPIRKIAGPVTGLFLPSQITFDGKGDYIVSDRCRPPKCSSDYAGAILIFDARADGNVLPLRVLAGAKTKLSGPDRVAYDPVHDMIYAANLYTSTITGYPAGSSGNVAPTIFIHGSKTHLWNPDAIAIDKAGYLYVGNEPLVPGPPPASILVFAPGANGNVAPVQIIAGSKTRLAEVNGLSVY